jgi:hypothetical protein
MDVSLQKLSDTPYLTLKDDEKIATMYSGDLDFLQDESWLKSAGKKSQRCDR